MYEKGRIIGDYTPEETNEYFELERVPRNKKEHLEFVLSLLNKPRTLKDLIKLIPEQTDLSEKQIIDYLDRLLRKGLVYEPSSGKYESAG